MALNETTAGDILKIHYQGPIRNQLNNAHALLSKVRKESRNYVGKQAYVPLLRGRNHAIVSVGEGSTLPDGGSQVYDKAIYTKTHHYGRIRIEGPTIATMKSDRGAFVRAIKSEMKGLVIDCKQDLQRQCWGNGSGVLTALTSGNTSNVATLQVNSTKYLNESMYVLIAEMDDGADGATAESTLHRQIVSIDSATQVTLDSAIDWSSRSGPTNYALYRASHSGGTTSDANRDPGSWATLNELWGVRAIVSDANPGAATNPFGDSDQGFGSTHFGQIDRSSANFWKANTLTNSSGNRDVTLDLLQQALDEADIESDMEPGFAITSHAVRRRVASLVQHEKRYAGTPSTKLDGGYDSDEGVAYGGITIVSDKSAGGPEDPSQLNGIFFLSCDALEWQLLEDWQWMQRDGAVLHRKENQDTYEATLFCYTQLGAEACNRHTWLGDLNETA